MARDLDDPFLATQASQSAATSPLVLVTQTNDVRPLARLLRGIGWKHNAVLTISDAGLEVTVEDMKTLCATAFIPTNLFQTFEYTPEPRLAPVFEISLDGMLQCLNIFGNAGGSGSNGGMGRMKGRWAGEGEGEGEDVAGGVGKSRNSGREKRTGCRMTWGGEGDPLSMFLQDEGGKGPITNCELTTFTPDEMMNQPFDHDNRALYLIMKSEWFKEALSDLPPSSSRITLTATPPDSARLPDNLNQATGNSEHNRRRKKNDVGNFGIRAEGDFGDTQLDYPNDKEVMDRFEVDTDISFSYHSHHFAVLTRALQHSIKIALMIEHTGFLCLQIMMPVTRELGVGEHQGILEFKMHALEDDE